mgnify:CR=1 FL=1
MTRLNGLNKIKTAVFISGTGSNLKNLLKFTLKKNSKFEIKIIISSNSNAKGLVYAKNFKVEKKVVNFKKMKSAENILIHKLKKLNIELICLAGFMKILSKNFIKKFSGIILNIHPSLLPKYKGLNTHKRAILNKEKYSGCTVHFVSSKLDSGKIILQKKVKILKKDTPKTLKKKILKHEHALYPKAVNKILTNP